MSGRRVSLVLAAFVLTLAGRLNGQVQLYSQPGPANQPGNTSGLTAEWDFQNTGSTDQTLNLTCYTGGQVTSCSVPTSSQPLPAWSIIPVRVTFSTGSPGGGSLTLYAFCGSCSFSYQGGPTETVLPQYQDSVTPKGATTPTRQTNSGPYAAVFTIKNTGYYSDTYSVTCSTAGPVTCTRVSATSVTLGGQGASTTDTAYYNATSSAGTGTLTLTAVSTHASDAGSYSVPVVSYGVAVTPKGGTTATRTANTGGYSESFTVQNTGSASNTYSFTCSGAGGVTCGTVPAAVTLAANGQTTVSMPYSVGAPGTGTLSLTAAGTNASDQGSYSVPIALYNVTVTPKGGTAATRTANTGGYSESFTVQNTGSVSNTYSFTCSGAGGVTCGTVPAAVTLASNGQTTVSMPYSVGAPGTGTLSLTASGTNASDQGSYSVPIVSYGVAVTPKGGTAATRVANTGGYSESFTLQNTGSASNTYSFTCSGAGGLTCGTVPAAVTLASNGQTTVSMPYSVGAPGTGTLSLTAAGTNASDQGSYSVPIVSYGVAVTPKGGTTATRITNTGAYSESFTVQNTGSASNTYSFSCAGSGVTCLTAPAAVTLAGSGGQTTVSMPYNVGPTPGTGTLSLTATGTNASDQGSYSVPIAAPTVSVTPKGSAMNAPANTSTDSVNFIMTNMANGQPYTLELVCGGVVGNCWSPAGYTFTSTYGYGFWIMFSTASPGAARVRVRTYRVGTSDSDSGWVNVTVMPQYQVAVTPKGTATATRAANATGYSETFTVTNTGFYTDGYTLACVGVTNVGCAGTTPGWIPTLAPGTSTSVTVSYYTESVGQGTLKLAAVGCCGGIANDTGSFSVPVVAAGVAVTPQNGTTTARPASSGPFKDVFTIQNTGGGTKTFTVTCSGSSNVTCSGVSASSVILSAGASTTDTATYSVGAVGTGRLTLTASAPEASGSGGYRIAVVSSTQQAPTTSVSGVNPGNTSARDLCFAIALGPAAASECGDLRIVHALPSTRTMGRVRAPTLLYNSQFAHPYPLVAALVTLSTTAIPDSVEAVLSVNGTTRRVIRWGGPQWVAGATRLIVIGYDGLGDPTGINAYTLEVASIYGTSRLAPATPASGQLLVVNRQASPFGAGWWLAGLEQLNLSNMIWVAGDGSVRQYQQVSGTTDQWVAPSVDHPDTMKRVVSGTVTYYVRYAGKGIEVWFNTLGQHVYTYNRQRHQTTFAYDPTAGTLTSVTLPTAGAVRVYQFTYTPTAPYRLVSVTAPDASGIARNTTITQGGGFISQIQDPDGGAVQFTAGTSVPELIASRIDRRGTQVTFAYDTLGGRKIAGSTFNMGSAPPIVLTIAPQQSLGLKQSIDSASAFTLIRGPRTDSADVTQVWQDGWGQPVLIQDAHSSQTKLLRGDARWPALVTEVDHPNAWRQTATYDARGNLASTTDYGFGGYPTTVYQWDQKWDALTEVKRPEADSTTMAYDPTTGNRLWMQDGRGDSTRVTFGYDGFNQVASLTLPGTPAEQFTYNPMGNVETAHTPKGYTTTYFYNGAGQPIQVETPIDTVIAPSQGPRFVETYTAYDILGRDTLVRTVGPFMDINFQGETLYVRKFFNPNGQPDSLSRWSGPDTTHIGVIRTRWVYDPAGRVTLETAPDGQQEKKTYDPAGNVIADSTRRGHIITIVYDALNRVVTRSLPAVSYLSRPSNIMNPPQNDYPAYQIAADTRTFTYDALGRVLTAENADAKVKRSYYPDGMLDTDSLWIRSASGTDFTQHAYGIKDVYDRDGRRTALQVPTQLSAAGLSGMMAFAYEPQLGQVQTVYDPQGNRYAFSYTRRGELRSLAYPAQYAERFSYNVEGDLAADTIWNLGSTAFPRLAQALVRATTYLYDAQGRLLHSGDPNGYQDTLDLSYSGLGHLARNTLTERAILFFPEFGGSVPSRFKLVEGFTFDALANRTYGETRDTTWTNGSQTGTAFSAHVSAYQPGTGRITLDAVVGGQTSFTYNLAGDVEFTSNQGSTQGPAEERASFYAADGTLRAVDWRWVQSPVAIAGSPTKYAFDQYRYDALGRRVWLWSQKSCYEAGMVWYQAAECKTSLLRRTVWDGDQELAEIQMPGGTAANEVAVYENDVAPVQLPSLYTNIGNVDRNQYFGRVLYTPGRGPDRPIAVTRINFEYEHDDNGSIIAYTLMPPITTMPFWNRNGDAPIGAFTTGERRLCTPPTTSPGNCVSVGWSFFWSAFDRRGSGVWDNWHGSLLEGKRDKTGLDFRRNRYYDPATGRFTQEDPIGLAGGLNLYGFASGDPVNFSDPFGLCPKINNTRAPCILFLAAFSEADPRHAQAESRGIARAIINRAQDRTHNYGYKNTNSLDADIGGQVQAPNQVQGRGNGEWNKLDAVLSGEAAGFNSGDANKLAGVVRGVEEAYGNEGGDPTNGSTYWDHPPSQAGQGASQKYCAPTATVTIGTANFARCSK